MKENKYKEKRENLSKNIKIIEEGNNSIKKQDKKNMSRGCKCSTSSSTQSQSFKNKSGIITDNEYEITSEFIPEENNIEIEKEANF